MKNMMIKMLGVVAVFGAFVFVGNEALAADDTTFSVGANSDFDFEDFSVSATVAVSHDVASLGNFTVDVEALLVDLTNGVSDNSEDVCEDECDGEPGFQAGVLVNVNFDVTDRITLVAGVGASVDNGDSVVQVGTNFRLTETIGVEYRAIEFKEESLFDTSVGDLFGIGSTTHALRISKSF